MMLAHIFITGVLLLLRQQSHARTDSTGINIYKDLLRTKTDEFYDGPYQVVGNPIQSAYRNPALVLIPTQVEKIAEMDKRGANRFKNFMLLPQRETALVEGGIQDKEQEEQIFHFPRVVKRSVGGCSFLPSPSSQNSHSNLEHQAPDH